MDFRLNLDGESVASTEPQQPLRVEPTTPVRELLAPLAENPLGCVLICRDELLIGLFTHRDAVRLLASEADLDCAIQNVMVADPVCIATTETLGAAIGKMSSGGFRQLPVVDAAGRPVGLLTVDMILRYLVHHFPDAVYTLPSEAHQSTQ